MYTRIASILILILLTSSLMAQKKTYDYATQWKKIEDLVSKKGQPLSALKLVDSVYAQAKKENNDAQVLKALVYKTQINSSRDMTTLPKDIAALEKELVGAKEPRASLLHSLIATTYWQYFRQNRYVLYDRKKVQGDPSADIDTWSAEDLHAKISAHYLASLTNRSLLAGQKLSDLDPIIVKEGERSLRPTLYDLLAHQALDYFTNPERTIQKPIDAFTLNDPKAFAPAKEFTTVRFNSTDSGALELSAIGIYQELTKQHLNDKDPAALIDLDLGRLAYMHRTSVGEAKNDAYRKALSDLSARYPDRADAAMARYRILEMDHEAAMRYNPAQRKGQNRFALAQLQKDLKALESAFPKSNTAAMAFNLRQNIEMSQLQVRTESVNLPDQPFRALVTYANVKTLHYRIIPAKVEEGMDDGDRWSSEYWLRITNRKSIRQETVQLPQAGDLRQHDVEIKVDGLPIGSYLLLASTGEGFTPEKDHLSLSRFDVTSIGWFNNRNHYFFVDRETGHPLPQATVQVWQSKYDYNTRKRTDKKLQLLTADLDGHITMPYLENREGMIRFEVSWQKDHYFPADQQFMNVAPAETQDVRDRKAYEADNRILHLFTDRSIYRPGQIVHFKGLLVTKDFDTHGPRIMSGFKTTVKLEDANGKEADSLVLTSSEYGSISGRFTLPMNTMTGEFTLATEEFDQETQVRVEEYKRPKFHTDLASVKGEFQLNDTITVTGSAKAYAGNALNGAKVSYRVTRKARFLFPLWGRGGWTPSPEQEIANGSTVTDGSGNYAIRFKALPDPGIAASEDPVFDYAVTADVTDLNGETRSANSTISIGYRSLQLSIKVPTKEPLQYTDSLRSVVVKASNLAGEDRKVPYTLTVQRLGAPDRLIRTRYWNAPDTFLIPKADYLKWFPHDEYARETAPESWARETTLTTLKDTTGEATRTLDITGLKAGWYLFEATALDRNGHTVTTREYVQVNDRTDLGLANSSSYLTTIPTRNTLEVGEQAKLQLACNADDLWVLQERVNGEDRSKDKPLAPAGPPAPVKKKKPSAITSEQTDAQHPFTLLKLTKGMTALDITAREEDKGGFGYGHAFVKHNRFFNDLRLIGVPWTDKELDVTFKTYRDKTEPGSKENWTVTVSGKKGEKLAAEMLASAYDASLDQFLPHAWRRPELYPVFSSGLHWQGLIGFRAAYPEAKGIGVEYEPVTPDRHESLLWQGAYGGNDYMRVRGMRSDILMADAAVPAEQPTMKRELSGAVMKVAAAPPSQLEEVVTTGYAKTDNKALAPPAANPIRTNFNETAFFYPDLHTDAEGNVQFSFTMPEALTQWKAQVFAHTKDLAMGMATQTIVTQKELMVQPNAPRFLREGDRISFAGKVANMAEKEITGQAQLQLIDPETNEPVDGWFKNTFPIQYFTVPAGQSSAVKFEFEVPTNYNKPLRYRIVATSGNKSDGEEAELPVLSNRMLVTESMPILMKGDGTKTFSFDKLLKNGSPSLTHHALTVEYSANPAWYAVQSLPYLAEFPHECAEQLFNRFYANALAEKVLEKAPKIKAYYAQWAKDTTKNRGLISNLEKNPELKSVLLQETPWVMEAKNETDQKKNIAILFDLARINKELETNLDKLEQAQSPNGGFTWFPGGPDDRFITQYIASSIGHLKTLQAVPADHESAIDAMQREAITYLDQRIREDYEWLIRNKADLKKHQLSSLQIQYLYARSMAKGVPMADKNKVAHDYYLGQAAKFWLQHGRMEQGMIALVLSRKGDAKTASAIIASLKQFALQSPTLGMYWANKGNGYYWYDAPVETQSLLIEAFAEVAHDEASVESMKQWLLTQKQTSNWKSTKATADAVYALLLQGRQWTAATPDVTIKLGDKGQQVVKSSPTDEAGTGYFKQVVDGKKVTEDLGKVDVTVRNTAGKQALSWGAVYWQYFENLDAITPAASPFSIKKGLFLEKNTDKGPVNVPVENGAELKPGDKLIVRIEIRADRDMEYVHLKDMRASGTEPLNVLSEYKWQGGLGYYESTRDASTNFFFSWMPKGTYVFEYPLFVSAEGNFSVGIAQAECMYAPEFSAHSEGLRIRVRE